MPAEQEPPLPHEWPQVPQLAGSVSRQALQVGDRAQASALEASAGASDLADVLVSATASWCPGASAPASAPASLCAADPPLLDEQAQPVDIAATAATVHATLHPTPGDASLLILVRASYHAGGPAILRPSPRPGRVVPLRGAFID
jgi:hypothetical protein